MSDIICIKCQLSNLWGKAVCNFEACLSGSGGEQMEFMFCMFHCCDSRELSPFHIVSTWEQPLVLLCSCQKLLSGASSSQRWCARPWESHPANSITVYSRSLNAPHNAFSWLALKDCCHQYCVSGSLGGDTWKLLHRARLIPVHVETRHRMRYRRESFHG